MSKNYKIPGDIMGVARKYKRKIICNNKEYFWRVGRNCEDCDRIYLHIVSYDKSLVLAYKVCDDNFIVESSGRIFQGKQTSGFTERYEYKMQKPPTVITPKFVSEMIQWAAGE